MHAPLLQHKSNNPKPPNSTSLDVEFNGYPASRSQVDFDLQRSKTFGAGQPGLYLVLLVLRVAQLISLMAASIVLCNLDFQAAGLTLPRSWKFSLTVSGDMMKFSYWRTLGLYTIAGTYHLCVPICMCSHFMCSLILLVQPFGVYVDGPPLCCV